MKAKLALLVSAVVLFIAVPSWAGTLTFDLSTCADVTLPSPCHTNADLGTYTATFKDGTTSIFAYGYKNGGSLTSDRNHLYIKSAGATEEGLGLNGTSDDEINVGQYIYLNLSQLAAMSILGGNLELGSVQVGEVGKVCATAAVGTPGTLDCVTYTGTLLTNGDITQGVTWSSTDDILSITATSNNVLVGEGLTVTTPAPAPEPGSFLLFGLALAGLAVMGVRRKSAFAGR